MSDFEKTCPHCCDCGMIPVFIGSRLVLGSVYVIYGMVTTDSGGESDAY